MNKLIQTASTLDKLLKFFSILVNICAVTMIVGLCIIGAGALFDLPASMIGTDWETVQLDFMSISVAPEYIPELPMLFLPLAAEMFLASVCLILCRLILRCLRDSLRPMTLGEPFHNTISKNLKKLAKYTLFLGITVNCAKLISSLLFVNAYGLPDLILSEKITRVSFNFTFDVGFLFVSATFLLLSYIFHYGEELQQLSDETL